MFRLACLTLPLLAASACTQDDLFRVTGFQQETFSNDADILFILDNSSSMSQESAELAINFGTFIETLAGEDGGNASADGLGDAVDNYIEFASRRTGFIDFGIGIASTDPADVGALRGERVEFGQADVTGRFQRAILCDSTCWTTEAVGNDPGYTCGDEYDRITEQVLDCECGAGGWGIGQNCGGGREEGLEQVLLAMCGAVEDPPEACFDPDESPGFTEDRVGQNEGLIRPGGTFIPVIVTDEGDASRREADADSIPENYERIFRAFGVRMAWAHIGTRPTSDPDNCNGDTQVPAWAVARYDYFVEETDGLRADIAVNNGNGCEVQDFGETLQQLGELINRLQRDFRLAAIPDIDTLQVFVDGREVDPAELSGDNEFGTGWSYNPDDNAIEFHGEAVPDYDEKVRIYYLPISGMPRELPF